jgi:SNF2 family DNA or RNA helicase
MPVARLAGAYYVIPSGRDVTTPYKNWIHTRLDWGWNKADWSWIIPIDVTTPEELTKAGFDVEGDLPDIPASPIHDEDRDLFLPIPMEDYQLKGVEQMLGERRILADEPGVGKTRQLITLAYNLDAARVLFIVPKISITTPWSEQLSEVSEIIKAWDGDPLETRTEGNLVVVQGKPHMKRLDGFGNGVLLTTDSALRASDEMVDWVIDWGPELMLVDEAHRIKSFDAQVSRHIRAVASRTPMVITATGTPMLKEPSEMMTLFQVTHTIDRFGGLPAFIKRYTYEDKWHKRQGIKAKMPEIRAELDKSIWIRRTKDEVLADLPKKNRRFVSVQVPLDRITEVHDAINEQIFAWLKRHPHPTEAEIDEWCGDNLRFITQMRVASGLAKVEEVTNRVERWFKKHPDDPLVVWACYQETLQAIREHAESLGLRVGVIDGKTSRAKRDVSVAAFQAGELDMIVASIYAGGTAITLTKGHNVVFAEVDWTPGLIVQAEDRCHRYGQTKPVNITTLIAEGTLDEHIQKVLTSKNEFLTAAAGGDTDVARKQHSSFKIANLLAELVEDAMYARQHG